MKKALLILGDQLFPVSFFDNFNSSTVFMAEDLGLCTHYKYHKHKIAFFLTSMRNYRDELRSKGHTVHYENFSDEKFVKRLESFLKSGKYEKLSYVEIDDKFFEKEILSLGKKLKIELESIEGPKFLYSRKVFENYLKLHPKPFMKSFYERARKRDEILLEKKDKPLGGKWSFDFENRKAPPKELEVKSPPKHNPGEHFDAVRKIVDENFSDHPGDLDDFWLATSRRSALADLNHFVKFNLRDFGDYQDAITNRDPFLFHSILSPYINIGFLTPKEVIDKVLIEYEAGKDLSLHSVEGFIRQVMGWREFVRGIYQNFSDQEEKTNFFEHKGKLTKTWYEGTTGIPPVDDAIKKAVKLGYCHHIERLMLLSNLMLLCRLDPKEVHKWFMEMFVDSADWVMGPNVYGMGQFSDGGIFATKPYISGSNYVLKMSDYKKGEWCEIWDALFWSFIGDNLKVFEKNPRMSMMARTYSKFAPEKKGQITKTAKAFIEKVTG